MSRPADLVQGTLDLLILKILALDPLHGWALSQRLKQVSGDVLQVSDGSLYPALHKLEQQGWIAAEWRPSENNGAQNGMNRRRTACSAWLQPGLEVRLKATRREARSLSPDSALHDLGKRPIVGRHVKRIVRGP
jgi:hypothetical protein